MRGEPSSVRDQLADELRAADWRPVYLLAGADDYSRQRGRHELVDALLPPEFHETSLTDLDGSATTAGRIVDELESMGFNFDGAPRQVVLVRNMPYLDRGRADEAAPLIARLEAGLPTGMHLVMETAATAPRDRRLVKAVARAGLVLEFREPANDGEAEAFVRGLASEFDVRLDRDATSEIVARCGRNTYRLRNELRKLADWAGPGGRLGRAEVEAMTALTVELAMFNLVDAVSTRNVRRALTELAALLAQGNAPLMIMGMLTRQYRLMLQARWLLDAGLADRRLMTMRNYDLRSALEGPQGLRAVWRERGAGILPLGHRQCIVDQQPYPIQKALQAANSFDAPTLEASLERLLQTDIALKSKHLSPEHEIELLIVDLCTRPTAGAYLDLIELLTD